MPRASKIEPAVITEYQEHMSQAARTALRRLRRPDALDVSEALGEAFSREKDDERRRLLTATRIHLLNEQLLKLDVSEEPKKPKPVKKAKPKPPPPEPEPEPIPEPEPKKPAKEAVLNTMDLDAAAMLMGGFGEEEEVAEAAPEPAPEPSAAMDEMAALFASDDDDTPAEPEVAAEDPFAELAALGGDEATETAPSDDPFAELASLSDTPSDTVSDTEANEDPFAELADLSADQESDQTNLDPFAELAALDDAPQEEETTKEDPFAELAALGDAETPPHPKR